MWAGLAGLLVLTVGSVVLAYQSHERVMRLEQELVRRQQDSQGQATEARALARQAQEVSTEANAKAALLEARLAEVALQRSQLDELMLSLSRSRDENLLVDVEAALRVALQQASITGSAEPLVAALRSAEERLARLNQPRLEGVRRAVLRDLERIEAVNLADVSALVMRIDEAIRQVDELPLQSSPAARAPAPSASSRAAAAPAPGASAPAAPSIGELAWWRQAGALVWHEVRDLVRVTRIDRPEAMLVAPEQGYFLRENLKLRLLNARLALLSRQFDTVQSDLEVASRSIQRYFDPRSRRTTTVQDLIRQVADQARHSSVPRPDETLAALTAATAGR
nr:uroporphyrinogen-III C-methyltransferase [Caldimonas tepidiphila]